MINMNKQSRKKRVRKPISKDSIQIIRNRTNILKELDKIKRRDSKPNIK